MENPPGNTSPATSRAASGVPERRSGRRVILMIAGIVLLGCGIAAATTAWWVKHNLYASAIKPVRLTPGEQQRLNAKLQVLQTPKAAFPPLTPEEQRRTLTITQKEINAYLASQDLGDRVRVELGEGRISATMIVPIPADSGLPLVSGTTLRVMMALDATMDAQRKLSIKLSDVRVGGISLPNAWLGDLKGVNLVAENIERDPAMQRFLAGIQEIEIHPDGLRVRLNE